MCAVIISDQVSMSVVAKGGVGRVFAIANLVISAFTYIEHHGSVSRGHRIANLVAPRSIQRTTATAPIIDFRLFQIHVIGIISCNQRNACWSILTFLIRN